MYDLNALLRTMVEQNASDLHLTVGASPSFRINGEMVRVKGPVLTSDVVKKLAYSVLTDDQKRRFEESKELDFAFSVKDVARLRGNLFVQRGSVAIVFRRVSNEIKPLREMGFSSQISSIVEKPHGLILVTGPTGSGKSTTIAAFLDEINRTRRGHIVTIEDPIEYTHPHKLSLVNQREVGADCESFSKALRQVLREDPDVILVGEIRDAETAESALKAAETGHLVFSTLHTNGTIATINRIVQLFPVDSQEYIRSLLSFTLEAILSQSLCARVDRKGRVLATEFLSMTPAIRALIRDNKLHQVYSQMQMGQDQHGMQTMNQSLLTYVLQGVVSPGEAMSHSPDPEELAQLIDGRNRTRRAS
jgi:twitching motility protein PilT